MARVAAAVAMLPVVLGGGSLRANMGASTFNVARNGVSRSLAGFMEVGCYKDTSSRIFQKYTKEEDLDTTFCADYCKDYPYYGLQNGNECWCGESGSDFDRHGEATNCDTACSGNDKINCGGRYAMQVFSQVVGLGCVKDAKDRVFTDKTTSSDMSPEFCQSHCASLGKFYYGTQYGVECWCGEEGTDYDKYGSATCDMPCSGDSANYCGGRYAMNVYLTGDATTPPVEDYACYVDSKDDRVGHSMITNVKGMTHEVCTAYCEDLGASWALVQYGYECFCADEGTEVDRLGSTTCDHECTGDKSQTCGGRDRFNAIPISGTVTPPSTYPCYADDVGDRVGQNMKVDAKMTYEYCTDHCNEYDAAWAMVQYGVECFCGYEDTDIDRLGSATCDMDCAGDDSQTCGGRNAFNAIALGGTGVEPSPGTPTQSPVTVNPGPPVQTTSPTKIETIPNSCSGEKSAIRFSAGSGIGETGRMYLEDGGCGTMTDLYKTRVEKDGWEPKGPIYILDENNEAMMHPTEVTGRWLITSELHVLRGSVFYCRGKGSAAGDGDCDELRIQSTGPTDYHEIRGHGGSLYFENTVVTSWDTPNGAVQKVYEGGRSYLNCVTEYESDETCEGQPKNDYGWCRMDIINSEMGYMGWFDSESYGLTWKVRGFCQDKSNPEVFDTSNVFGDIIDSDIHHMYYGMYSYGHQGGVWTNNKMHDNYQYGFDPHDDSDYLTIANNVVYNNVNHGIIASKRCNNVDIYDNEVYDGGAEAAGIFLHRSSDSARVYNNYIHDMQNAGIAILESFDADIYKNEIRDVRFGIRISLGGGNNDVHDNTFDNCSDYGLYTYKGSDAPEETDDGRPGENMFVDNEITNTEVGVKIKEGDNTVITGNTFTGTVELEFFDAKATSWSNNKLPDGVCVDIITSDKGVDIDESTFASSSGLPTASC